jgi:hypothetical protein
MSGTGQTFVNSAGEERFVPDSELSRYAGNDDWRPKSGNVRVAVDGKVRSMSIEAYRTATQVAGGAPSIQLVGDETGGLLDMERAAEQKRLETKVAQESGGTAFAASASPIPAGAVAESGSPAARVPRVHRVSFSQGVIGGRSGMEEKDYQRIKVLVETAERSFRGYVYKPNQGQSYRLSDYLNHYADKFLRLSEVEVTDRGQHYRVGDKQEFVAIAVTSIVYITPMEGEDDPLE